MQESPCQMRKSVEIRSAEVKAHAALLRCITAR